MSHQIYTTKSGSEYLVENGKIIARKSSKGYFDNLKKLGGEIKLTYIKPPFGKAIPVKDPNNLPTNHGIFIRDLEEVTEVFNNLNKFLVEKGEKQGTLEEFISKMNAYTTPITGKIDLTDKEALVYFLFNLAKPSLN